MGRGPGREEKRRRGGGRRRRRRRGERRGRGNGAAARGGCSGGKTMAFAAWGNRRRSQVVPRALGKPSPKPFSLLQFTTFVV